MPQPLTVCCFSKIQIGYTFLVPAHLGSPGKRAVKRMCVCCLFLMRSVVVSQACCRQAGGSDGVLTMAARTAGPMWLSRPPRPGWLTAADDVDRPVRRLPGRAASPGRRRDGVVQPRAGAGARRRVPRCRHGAAAQAERRPHQDLQVHQRGEWATDVQISWRWQRDSYASARTGECRRIWPVGENAELAGKVRNCTSLGRKCASN